jgi:hypothetical protein
MRTMLGRRRRVGRVWLQPAVRRDDARPHHVVGRLWLLRTLFIRAEAWQMVGANHHQLPEPDPDEHDLLGNCLLASAGLRHSR